MYEPNAPLVTMEDIEKAREVIMKNPEFRRTPLLTNIQNYFQLPNNVKLHLKMESMQVTGSFKARGIINQLANLPEGIGTEDHKLVTMSAGNYGRSFAYMISRLGLKGQVFMPKTAPINRATLIESYGVKVKRVHVSELQPSVDAAVREEGMFFLHSFDQHDLIAGYGSIALEILEEVHPDVVLCCCGGGGSLSGIAAALRLSGLRDCKIYGVEPEGARTMHESFRVGRPVSMDVKTIAAGLSPPFAGQNTYRHCKEYVDDIILMTDREILKGMFSLYNAGLVVEPSGAAAFAAVLHDKVPDVAGKNVVVVCTGGNVQPDELLQLREMLDGFDSRL